MTVNLAKSTTEEFRLSADDVALYTTVARVRRYVRRLENNRDRDQFPEPSPTWAFDNEVDEIVVGILSNNLDALAMIIRPISLEKAAR